MRNTEDKKKSRLKKRRKRQIRSALGTISVLLIIFGVFGILYYLIDNVIFPTDKDYVVEETNDDEHVNSEGETRDVEQVDSEEEAGGAEQVDSKEKNRDKEYAGSQEAEADGDKNTDSEEAEITESKNGGNVSRYDLIHSGIIYEGISLDEVDVSGMNYDEATAAYTEYVKQMDKRKIIFKDSLGTYNLSFSEINLDVDVEAAVCDALTYGRTGNILNRFKEIKRLEDEPVKLTPEKSIDYEALKELIENNATSLTKAPINASMTRSEGDFVVLPSEDGVGIEYDKTIDLVKTELGKEWEQKNMQINVETKILKPEYSEEDFYGVDSLLGRAVTEYNIKKTERIANLIAGTEKIADNVVLPGEQFSVYNTVAPFTEENGYKNAGQYINAELVDGLGGGICQVATTLYDAVLEAELQVDERYPHSMTVSYVDKGMDAAIAEGYEDFKFTNNTGYPIYIDAYTGGGSISIAIYGHETRSANRRIEFESQVIETFEPGEEKTVYDDTIPEGTTNVTEAHTGYYVELWKNIYENGELVDTVKINGSQYSAISKTTRIGTKKE